MARSSLLLLACMSHIRIMGTVFHCCLKVELRTCTQRPRPIAGHPIMARSSLLLCPCMHESHKNHGFSLKVELHDIQRLGPIAGHPIMARSSLLLRTCMHESHKNRGFSLKVELHDIQRLRPIVGHPIMARSSLYACMNHNYKTTCTVPQCSVVVSSMYKRINTARRTCNHGYRVSIHNK